MSTSIWHADGTQPLHEVDFLVIGAGLVGSAAAYFAAQAGHDVLVIDRADVALGASGRNAGFMISGLDSYYHQAVARYGDAVTREMWALSHETLAFWRERIADSGGSVPYAACGSLLLSESEKEADDVRQAADALKAAGIDIIYHDSDPLQRGYFNAIEQPKDGAVHPAKLTRAVLQQSGAKFTGNNEVYAIEQHDTEQVTVYARQGIYRAQYVMLCTNGYSLLVEPTFAGKVIPTRGQVMVTEPLDVPPMETCGYSNYGYMYYRTTFDNRLLIGGARHLHTETENDTTEDRPRVDVQASLDAYRQRHFADVTAPVARRWAGVMGFSVDGLPMAGTLPDKPRVGFAVGFTGHGLSLGAGTAKRAVRRLLHGTSAGAVDFARFS